MEVNNLRRVRKEVDEITDALGKPIEKGIRELVIGLKRWGIETEQSCEGHYRWGTPYPWVTIPFKEARKLNLVVAWQNRPVLENGKSNKNTWVIRPSVFLELIPEDRGQSLKKLKARAAEFGFFLQKLPASWGK